MGCESMRTAGILVFAGIIVSICMMIHSCEVPILYKPTEPMALSDTFSLYKNVTNCYEMQLPGLSKDQIVQVYLSITSGTVELCLLNSHNEPYESPSEIGTIQTFLIDREDDYRLLIDVKDADFIISVSVLEKSDLDGG